MKNLKYIPIIGIFAVIIYLLLDKAQDLFKDNLEILLWTVSQILGGSAVLLWLLI